MTIEALTRLESIVRELSPLAVAVSGGVDSMTLAHVTHRLMSEQTVVFHAVSPAVPPEATARVQRHAERAGWTLRLINAGEYADPEYRKNPVNRCYYCKTNLYSAIAKHTGHTIISGANMDDLKDYRPGLQAADNYAVRHPFIEAGIDKAAIRAIARMLELNDIAELPASPCLSSRIETGIAIQAEDLVFVHRIERLLNDQLQPKTVRCRIRRDGVHIELDPAALTNLKSAQQDNLRARLNQICHSRGQSPLLEPYQQGSAFLHEMKA